jgi:glutamate 5-kinase
VETVSNRLAKAKRIVIKVGSALLVEQATGQVKQQWLTSLVADVASLKAKGAEVILVSSGAIALGRYKLGFRKAGTSAEPSRCGSRADCIGASMVRRIESA